MIYSLNIGSRILKAFLSVLFINPLLFNLYKKCFTFFNGGLVTEAKEQLGHNSIKITVTVYDSFVKSENQEEIDR